jgi:hypothetical protein
MQYKTEQTIQKPSFFEKTKNFLNRDVKSFLPSKGFEKLRSVALTVLAAGSIAGPMNMDKVMATTPEGLATLKTELAGSPLESSTDSKGNVDTAKLASLNSVGNSSKSKIASKETIKDLKGKYDAFLKQESAKNPSLSQAEIVAKYTSIKGNFVLDTVTAGKLKLVTDSFAKPEVKKEEVKSEVKVDQTPTKNDPQPIAPIKEETKVDNTKIEAPKTVEKPAVPTPKFVPDPKIQEDAMIINDQPSLLDVFGTKVNAQVVAGVELPTDYNQIVESIKSKSKDGKKVNSRYVLQEMAIKYAPELTSAQLKTVYESNDNASKLNGVSQAAIKQNPDKNYLNYTMGLVKTELTSAEAKFEESKQPNKAIALAALAGLMAGLGTIWYSARKIENKRSRRDMAAEDIQGGYNNVVVKPLKALRVVYSQTVININELIFDQKIKALSKLQEKINNQESIENLNKKFDLESEIVKNSINKKIAMNKKEVKESGKTIKAITKNINEYNDSIKKIADSEQSVESMNDKINNLKLKLNQLKGLGVNSKVVDKIINDEIIEVETVTPSQEQE